LEVMLKTDVREAHPSEIDAVRGLCRDYRDLLLKRTHEWKDSVETYYADEFFEPLLASLSDIHARPNGAIWVATLDDTVAGCGMYRRLNGGGSELQRVFVSGDARGHGLGRRLCTSIMDQAQADGCNWMRLDTGKPLTEAVTLYRALGFVECPPPADLPEALRDVLLRFERSL
jgi:GNAT superfamily N-acetyltransferase